MAILSLYSCASNGGEDLETAGDNADTVRYYDIQSTVREQIGKITSTPTFMYMITLHGTTKDSVLIDTATLIKEAAPFLQVNLNDHRMKKNYRETVFEDGDTRSIVLSYSAKTEDLPLKSVAVLLDNQTHELKRIDIIRSYGRNDTSFNERLAWIADQSFRIVKIASRDTAELTTQTHVVWGGRD